MTMKMAGRIPECEEKDLLKLKTQQDISRFSINQANNAQGSMPLTFTNKCISIPHRG